MLDSRLLEVLLQIAVLQAGRRRPGFHTGELRIDELLVFLRERYGIYIDQLPRGDGFATTSIEDRARAPRQRPRVHRAAARGRLLPRPLRRLRHADHHPEVSHRRRRHGRGGQP